MLSRSQHFVSFEEDEMDELVLVGTCPCCGCRAKVFLWETLAPWEKERLNRARWAISTGRKVDVSDDPTAMRFIGRHLDEISAPCPAGSPFLLPPVEGTVSSL